MTFTLEVKAEFSYKCNLSSTWARSHYLPADGDVVRTKETVVELYNLYHTVGPPLYLKDAVTIIGVSLLHHPELGTQTSTILPSRSANAPRIWCNSYLRKGIPDQRR